MLTVLSAVAAESRRASTPDQLEPLMAGMAAGDQDALAQLYRRTRAAVYGLALSILRNSHDAEDITQDTFVRAWERAGQYVPQGTPMGWLLSITRNLSLMKLRERDKTHEPSQEEWDSLPADSPELTLEDRQILTAALSALSDQERQVVVLHVVAGLKHRETARLLELPLATVLSKYHRALLKLRTILKGDDTP